MRIILPHESRSVGKNLNNANNSTIMMLEIDGWKVGIRFSAAHIIPGHHKCSRLHGHDYGVKVRIYGDTDNPMLMDFVEIKKELRNICDEMDHHIIIPQSQAYIKSVMKGEQIQVVVNGKKYFFPRDDVIVIDVQMATAEELARYMARRLVNKVKFPPEVKGFEVCVEEGPGQGACHYTPVGD